MSGCQFTAQSAREALEKLGGSVLFEKVLTSSDANGSGRLVIPKSQAEVHFPFLEQQAGMTLHLTDTDGGKHAWRLRFWVNNQSRMYLLENTAEVQQKYSMAAGDVLVFAKLSDGSYGICGRKGTREDVSRKPAVRRSGSGVSGDGSPAEGGAPSSAGTQGGGTAAKRPRVRGGSEAGKSKRMRERQAVQAVQSLFSYWSASSLPMRRDGVFRAVPNSAAQEGNKVVAQFGAWSAIVSVGGELFQAFFDTYDAATAAFEAALQSAGKGEEQGGGGGVVAAAGPRPNTRRAASAEPSSKSGRTAAEDSPASASPAQQQQPEAKQDAGAVSAAQPTAA